MSIELYYCSQLFNRIIPSVVVLDHVGRYMFLLLFLSLFRCLEENQWDYNKALTAFNFLMVCVFYALHLRHMGLYLLHSHSPKFHLKLLYEQRSTCISS